MLPVSPLFRTGALEQLPSACPTTVCWVFVYRVCTLFVCLQGFMSRGPIIKTLLPWSPDGGISSAPGLDLDDETLDFEPQPGAIFINETCGDVGHGMEIICGHHWAVVIFKTYPQTLWCSSHLRWNPVPFLLNTGLPYSIHFSQIGGHGNDWGSDLTSEARS